MLYGKVNLNCKKSGDKMKKLSIPSLVIVLVLSSGCFNLSVDGPSVNSKKQVEEKIANTILFKAEFCGMNAAGSYIIRNLGNSELKRSVFSIPQSQTQLHIMYSTAEVDRCIIALNAFPCPTSEMNRAKGDNEFLTSLLIVRGLYCTFTPVDFFDFSHPMEGRLF
jgi:hypothetical protein